MADTEVLNSILLSVKKTLGIMKDATEFDEDIIIAINSVLLILRQIGVGTSDFVVKDETAIWEDFIGSDTSLELIKSYVGLKVGMIFDPPQSSALMEAKNNMISELEFRISVTVDPVKEY